MQNAGLDEAQPKINIAGRNINNLGYADDTTLMAESKEDLKSLFMWVKEESEKAGLKLNIQKNKIIASVLFTSWQIDGKSGKKSRFSFLGLQNDCGDYSHKINRHLLLRRKTMANLDSILESSKSLCQPSSISSKLCFFK